MVQLIWIVSPSNTMISWLVVVIDGVNDSDKRAHNVSMFSCLRTTDSSSAPAGNTIMLHFRNTRWSIITKICAVHQTISTIICSRGAWELERRHTGDTAKTETHEVCFPWPKLGYISIYPAKLEKSIELTLQQNSNGQDPTRWDVVKPRLVVAGRLNSENHGSNDNAVVPRFLPSTLCEPERRGATSPVYSTDVHIYIRSYHLHYITLISI